MQRLILLLLTLILAIPAISFAGVIAPARVTLVDGDVMFRTPDNDEWLPASVNTPLDEGDAIWTPSGSRTEIQLGDGTVVRLDKESQLDLIAVEDGFTQMHLANGKLYLRTSKNSGKDSIQIDADDTTILPDSRTRLRIDMLPESQEDVTIFKGAAYVEGNGSRTRVRSGEHIALEDGHSELLPLNPPDNWEIWNSERDRSQSRASAESNLPDELQAFSSELDSHGRWEFVPEYGRVWRPTVVISDNWAPYQSGRWIWKGSDYVWISYENWGWAPYHYGRWAVISGIGWCWVPPVRGDIYWGPGYVGWYQTGNYVGWTPLAPGETFYGHRHYGNHSVNVANNQVNSASIVFKNRNAHGGFNLILQGDFLSGRAVFQKPPSNTAVSVSVSLGSPRIQPIRETRMPIIKQTPPRVTPPLIRHQDNHALKARFPRVAPETDKQRSPHPLTPPANAQSTGQSTAIKPFPTAAIPRQSNEDRPHKLQQPASVNNQEEVNRPAVSNPGDKLQGRSASASKPESTKQGIKPRDQKQRKIWKVITKEPKSEKENKFPK